MVQQPAKKGKQPTHLYINSQLYRGHNKLVMAVQTMPGSTTCCVTRYLQSGAVRSSPRSEQGGQGSRQGRLAVEVHLLCALQKPAGQRVVCTRVLKDTLKVLLPRFETAKLESKNILSCRTPVAVVNYASDALVRE
eukprot:982814-Pelagomonas_calceolata.AAC.8